MAQEIKFEELNMETGPRINKFKFLKEELRSVKRVFFLPKIYKDTAHMKDGYGYFECLSGEAKKAKNPSGNCPACEAGMSAGIKTYLRYGMHVLTYATNPDGNLKTPFSYDIQAFIKNEQQYKKVYALYQQYGQELFNHDFVVRCENTDFQNFTYSFDLKCVWKTQTNAKEILADIKQKTAEFNLSKIIAPEISLETMQSIISGKLPPRFATKNQSAATQTPQHEDASMAFPPAGSAPMGSAPVSAKVAVAAGAGIESASKSDLDILNELAG